MSQLKGVSNDEQSEAYTFEKIHETYRDIQIEKIKVDSSTPSTTTAENVNSRQRSVQLSETVGLSSSPSKSPHVSPKLSQIPVIPPQFKNVTVTQIKSNIPTEEKFQLVMNSKSAIKSQREVIAPPNSKSGNLIQNKVQQITSNSKPDEKSSSLQQVPSISRMSASLMKLDSADSNNFSQISQPYLQPSYIAQHGCISSKVTHSATSSPSQASYTLVASTSSVPSSPFLLCSTPQQSSSCGKHLINYVQHKKSELEGIIENSCISILHTSKASSQGKATYGQSSSRIVCAGDKPRITSYLNSINSVSESVTLTPVSPDRSHQPVISCVKSANSIVYIPTTSVNSANTISPEVESCILDSLAKQKKPQQKLSERFPSSTERFPSNTERLPYDIPNNNRIVRSAQSSLSSPSKPNVSQYNEVASAMKTSHSGQIQSVSSTNPFPQESVTYELDNKQKRLYVGNERELYSPKEGDGNGTPTMNTSSDDESINDQDSGSDCHVTSAVSSSLVRHRYDNEDEELDEEDEIKDSDPGENDDDCIYDPDEQYQPEYKSEVSDYYVLSSGEEEPEDAGMFKECNEIGMSVVDKEPVITEDEYAFGELSDEMCDEDSENDELDELNHVYGCLQCRSVRIGSYKFVPCGNVFFSVFGVKILVPPLSSEMLPITLKIPMKSIKKVLAHFGTKLPLVFLYVSPTVGSIIRSTLKMGSDPSYYFNPLSSDEMHKRITLLPEEIPEDTQATLKELFEDSDRFEELTWCEANKILMSSSPKEVQQSVKVPPNPIQTIMVFPPRPERGGISINTEDYACLGEDIFLNDVIIDFYLKYLMMREIKTDEEREKIHIFSSFFYKRLTDKATPMNNSSRHEDLSLTPAEIRHNRVKNWTKNIDIFSKDFIIIPINENCHWFLAIICFPGLEGPVRMSDNTPIGPVKTKVKPRSNITSKVENEECIDRDFTIGSTTISAVKQDSRSAKLFTVDEEVDVEQEDRDEADGKDEDVDFYYSSDDDTEYFQRIYNGDADNEEPVNEPIKQPCILVFDSLAGASRARIIATLRDYLKIEYKAKHNGKERDFSKNVVKGDCPKVPQQNNFTDCGLYLLEYVETFLKKKIPDYRVPMTCLKRFIEPRVVSTKRWFIQQLIHNLMKEQNIHIASLNLPQLKLTPYDNCDEDFGDSDFDDDDDYDEDDDDDNDMDDDIDNDNNDDEDDNSNSDYESNVRYLNRQHLANGRRFLERSSKHLGSYDESFDHDDDDVGQMDDEMGDEDGEIIDNEIDDDNEEINNEMGEDCVEHRDDNDNAAIEHGDYNQDNKFQKQYQVSSDLDDTSNSGIDSSSEHNDPQSKSYFAESSNYQNNVASSTLDDTDEFQLNSHNKIIGQLKPRRTPHPNSSANDDSPASKRFKSDN